MPIYEYRCESCQEVSDFIQKFSDPNPKNCPKCQKGPLTKLLSETSFQLKGGGWYTEGYHKGGKKTDGKTETTGSSEGGSSNAKNEGTKSASSPAPTSSSEKSASKKPNDC